ncbi:MAG: glyoxalase [Frankiales bacterium]|nr:glyoxalase [Frankiales bacterium]
MVALRWDAVTIDCSDPDRLAGFWAELLRVEVRGRWEQYVGLEPVAPGMPRLVFQQVDDARPTKTTLHLDLHVTGPELLGAAVARAVALGATEVRGNEQDGQTWQTLADPEGNLFCLVSD